MAPSTAARAVLDEPGSQPLTDDSQISSQSSASSPKPRLSSSSASTVSLMFEHLATSDVPIPKRERPYRDDEDADEDASAWKDDFQHMDIEDGALRMVYNVDKKYKRWLMAVCAVCLLGWILALFLFVSSGSYKHRSTLPHDPDATNVAGTGRKITIAQIQSGAWRPRRQQLSWIAVPNGGDGYVLEKADPQGHLIVENILSRGNDKNQSRNATILMKHAFFEWDNKNVISALETPSPDLKSILCLSNYEKNWRHSYSGAYWLFDVDSQTANPLDPSNAYQRVQLAIWSPTSDSVLFVRDNNMFLRKLNSEDIIQITNDGGENMFNGVPDWVYEEEVFSGRGAAWWSLDGNYIAFLATNESSVPEFPVQYYLSRPTGDSPKEGLENYPDVRRIKYPKAGAPNPIVRMRFYDVAQDEVFDVPIENDFADLDRLITEVVWANDGKVLVRQTNRESDLLKMVLVDVKDRTGKVVREQDVTKLDGGWFEISETTTFVPADPSSGREHDGYLDTIIHDGYDHLGYFTPLDNSEPKVLTSGNWEVVEAPSAIDLENNYVYFIATKESSIQRHVYKVNLDGSGFEPVTDVEKEAYYSISFSKAAKYALLTYMGPNIPWQKIISTPSQSEEKLEKVIEENKDLASLAAEYELPIKKYETINIDGFELNVVERRPPHFDKNKKYPVLFFLYAGPGSQTVHKVFEVDFQAYVASTLGYIVVTVDGRGTGFLGRKLRCIVRGNLGYWEAHDQIETAKSWAKKTYVDETRMAIWGWSYGGFMTLKTLEQDAGQTFKYGMAVAPVTDWRFYDSIYTERYMHTPQHNPEGYANASISNVTAISQNVRWLIMHGASDDNVHFQNTLTLLDQFDLAATENYDVHVFPDSDHSIFFHGANKIVYDKLGWWLVNAFNGEWEKIENPVPLRVGQQVGTSNGRKMVKKREEFEQNLRRIA